VKIRDKNGMAQRLPEDSLPAQGARPDAGHAASTSGKSRQDRVELPEYTRAIQIASCEMRIYPEIRVDKVDYFKSLVKSLSYWVPGEKIAERMLGEGLFV
jgi:hypothetical protein